MALTGTSIVPKFELYNDIPKILLDAKRINEVLTNILLNASQAMPKGGNIYIRSLINEGKDQLLNGNSIQIDIEDTGIGIPSDKINEIFTPFFTTKEGGHGLGLATVYNIIKKHNGEIKVYSTPGNGTTFSIYLPLNVPEKDNILKDSKNFKFKNLVTILMLDDNREILENIEDLFLEYNISITGFSDPELLVEEYQNSLDSRKYDLVILDLTLIGYNVDGLDVLRQLRKIDHNVRALVFSGHFDKPVVSNYQDYGFVGRIDKPLVLEQFLAEIKKAIIF